MLESVGLTPQAERVYATLMRRPVADAAAVADELELPAADVQDALRLLAERALVVPSACQQTAGVLKRTGRLRPAGARDRTRVSVPQCVWLH